ncbi:MAG: UDP-3-O-acyl-N-acetylglucosamine deacetylase [Chlamydia sp.]
MTLCDLSIAATQKVRSRRQRTLARETFFSGTGIHTGQNVSMKFCPKPPGTGIIFQRVDLPGKPIIPARIEYVFDTSRSTNLAIGDVRVYTVEHVLAALKAYQIDNLVIELTNLEPPVGNGSSDIFVQMIESAGIVEEDETIPIFSIRNPIYWSSGDIHIVALPSDEYRVSYTLHYPTVASLGTQYCSFPVTADGFKSEIASCRTFALYEELSFLMDRGLIKGGSLENAVVIQKDSVISKGGLFFPNEMVRHKILDLIGDVSLVGVQFTAHIISLLSGHASNYAFSKVLYNHLLSEIE